MVFSHSRLSTFEQCPRKYAFGYIEKPELEEEKESIEAFLGTRVHEALEKLYDLHKRGRLLSKQELAWVYDDLWKKNWRPEVRVNKAGLTPEHYKATGERQLAEYYAHHEKEFADESLKTVGLERIVAFQLRDDKKYGIRGVIDRLTYDSTTGAYQIHDYKTGASLPPQRKLNSNAHEGRQLGLYDLAVRHSWPDAKSVSLHWHFLAFDKEMVSKRTKEQLAALEADTIKLIERIEDAKDEGKFPTRVSELCNYCAFQELCPAWKHLMTVEKEPLDKFLNEPGVKLVNAYAKIKTELDEYKAEKEAVLEELREALKAYSKKHGLEAVRGSDYVVGIKEYERHTLAPEDSPEYARLAQALKKAGKFEDFANLDGTKLREANEEGKLPEKIGKALEKATVTKTSEQLRLKPIKEKEK